MGIIDTLFRKPERVVLTTPGTKPSIFGNDRTHQSQLKRDLRQAINQGDARKVKLILDEVESSRQATREFFKAAKLGVDDKSSLNMLYEITQLDDKGLREQAIKLLFAAAQEKAPTVIKDNDDAGDILQHLEDYLLNEGNEEQAGQHAAAAAKLLGYHVISDTQKVIGPDGGDPHIANNFLHQLRSSKGVSNILFRLINQSHFTEDNERLQLSHLSGDGDSSIANSKPAIDNLRARVKKEILPKFKAISSTNFEFEWEVAVPNPDNPDETILETQRYDLEQFLDEVCDHGPEEAIKNFIDTYAVMVQYKEDQRASDNPDQGLISKIEREQQKALKFLFDTNKLQASETGAIIHDAISGELRQSGINRYLLKLYKAVTAPNEVAEVKAFARGYQDAYGEAFEYTNEAGTVEAIETMPQFRRAVKQKREALKETVDQVAEEISNNNPGIARTEAFHEHEDAQGTLAALYASYSERQDHIWAEEPGESKWDQGKREAKHAERVQKQNNLIRGFEQKLKTSFPEIEFGNLAEKGETSLTALRDFTRRNLVRDYADAGDAHEVHVKNGGAISALDGIRDKYEYQLNPAEELILHLVDTDRQQLERDNDQLDTGSFIEKLFQQERYGYTDVNATLTGGFELMRRIDASSVKPEVKTAAKKMILEEFLGIKNLDPALANTTLTVDSAGEVYDAHQKVFIMENHEENLVDRAKDRYTKEMGIFMKHALPGMTETDIGVFTSNFSTIQSNMEKMQGMEIGSPERLELEHQNLQLIGVSPDDNSVLSFDGQDYFTGTFVDPAENSELVRMFMETFQAIMRYLQNNGIGGNN